MLQWIDAMPIRDGQTDKCILKQEHTKKHKKHNEYSQTVHI